VTRDLGALAAANVCLLAAGAGIARASGFWRAPHELPGVVAIAYVAGVGAVGILATLALLAGLSLQVWQVILACGLLAAVGVRAPREPALAPSLAWSPAAKRVVLVIAGLLGIYLASLLARSALEPLRHWDAWAMWTMKARAIVLLDGLDTRVFAGDAYAYAHRDYPLLVPALEAIDFRFMGRLSTRVVDVQFWLLFVGFLGAVAQLLRDRVQPLLLWPALLLLGLAPSLAIQLEWSIADFPLALFFALAAICGWRYVEWGEPAQLVLLALFAGAAWATKREGLAFVVALFLLLYVFAAIRRRRLLPLTGALGVSLVAIVPWLAWVKTHGVEPRELPLGKAIDPGYLFDRTDRLGPAVRQLTWETFKPSWWLALFPLVLLAGVLALRTRGGRGPAVFLFALLGLMYASLLWAYWGDVPEIHQHVEHTARRVVTSALVTAGVFLPVLTTRFARQPAREARSPRAGTESGRSARRCPRA
jgi:hypothetical protein